MSCGWQMFFGGWADFWVLVSPFAFYYVMRWPICWRQAAGTKAGRLEEVVDSVAGWTFIVLFLTLLIGIIPFTLFQVGRYSHEGFFHILLDSVSCNRHLYGSRPGVPTPIMAGAVVGAVLCLPMWLGWILFEDVTQQIVGRLKTLFRGKEGDGPSTGGHG